MAEPTAPTSDGEPRPNVEPRAPIIVHVPTSISANARVGVLNDLAVALGMGATGLDRNASYDNSHMTTRINDIITAVNGKGASPPLKTYVTVDYNAFTSVVNAIATAMAALT